MSFLALDSLARNFKYFSISERIDYKLGFTTKQDDRILANFCARRQNLPANMGNNEQSHIQTEFVVHELQVSHP